MAISLRLRVLVLLLVLVLTGGSSALGTSAVAAPLKAESTSYEQQIQELFEQLINDARYETVTRVTFPWNASLNDRVNLAGLWADRAKLQAMLELLIRGRHAALGTSVSKAELAAEMAQEWTKFLDRLSNLVKALAQAGSMQMGEVSYADNPALFDQNGIDPNTTLLQGIATSAGEHGAWPAMHSEERILYALNGAVRTMDAFDKALQGLLEHPELVADGQLEVAMAMVIGYTPRGYCPGICRPALKLTIPKKKSKGVKPTYNAVLAKNTLNVAKFTTKLQKISAIHRVADISARGRSWMRSTLIKEGKVELQKLEKLTTALKNLTNSTGKASPEIKALEKKKVTLQKNLSELESVSLPQSCPPVTSAGGGGGGTTALGSHVIWRAAAADCDPEAKSPAFAEPVATPVPGGMVAVLNAAEAQKDYGGIDFSTMQLQYVADDPGSEGFQFSYSARSLTGGGTPDTGLGTSVLARSAADLRTWLALRPSTFWVNLNPGEPDRIIDERFGQTNAGRVLLEGDLEMKRTSAHLLNPRSTTGKQFWGRFARKSGSDRSCFSSRLWIEPGEVKVREKDDALYILSARLKVKTVAEHLGGDVEKDCPAADPDLDARNEALDQELILPQVEKAVNEAPEYAALRQSFMARVVAEWIRGRHAEGRRTSYDNVIDSNDLGPARTTGNWRPQQVYDAFLKDLNSDEFTYRQTVRQGSSTLVSTVRVGGVDWTALKLRDVGETGFAQQHPALAQDVKASLAAPRSSSDGAIWLGGTTGPVDESPLAKFTNELRAVTSGRTGPTAVVLIVGLLLIIGFPRAGSRRRRRAQA